MSVETHAWSRSATLLRLEDLPPFERRLVICARLWRLGPARNAELERSLSERHGPAVGRAVQVRLDGFLQLAFATSRRTLALNPLAASGAGGDECVLARIVALAAEGAREEAILIATLLIRADFALELARRATALGHLMLRRPGALALLQG